MTLPPKWFVPVVVIALLWNLIGLTAIVADIRGAMAAANAAGEGALPAARPLWSVIASVVAVVGGSVGCGLLLARRRSSEPVLWASLVGVILQDVGLLLGSNPAVAGNPTVLVLQGLVLVVAIGLVALARRALRAGWLGNHGPRGDRAV